MWRELEEVEQKRIADAMYERWNLGNGDSKTALEIEYFAVSNRNGRLFDSLIKEHLGIETVKPSKQTLRIAEMRKGLIRAGGELGIIDDLSEIEQLLVSSRRAALHVIRSFNDPTESFSVEVFATSMIIAWNCLFQARLISQGVDIYSYDKNGDLKTRDGRPDVLAIYELARRALSFPDDQDVFVNMSKWIKLRDLVEHRLLPGLEAPVAGLAQPLLLNYESFIEEWFGDEWILGSKLFVPLHLSFARSAEAMSSIRNLMIQLPHDIRDFLTELESGVSAEVLNSTRYRVKYFLIPVAANHLSSADAVYNYIRPEDIPDNLLEKLPNLTTLNKFKNVPVEGHPHRAGYVADQVEKAIGFRFSGSYHHNRAAVYYKAKPASNSASPELTNTKYCRYAPATGTYSYSDDWIEFLKEKLVDEDEFNRVTGIAPKPLATK